MNEALVAEASIVALERQWMEAWWRRRADEMEIGHG